MVIKVREVMTALTDNFGDFSPRRVLPGGLTMEEAMRYVLAATLILGWRPETQLVLDCICMMGLEERGEDGDLLMLTFIARQHSGDLLEPDTMIQPTLREWTRWKRGALGSIIVKRYKAIVAEL